jgi:hypothetical protein
VTGALLCSIARALGAKVEAEGASTTHLVDGGEGQTTVATAAAAAVAVSPWWLLRCFSRLSLVDVSKFRLAPPPEPPVALWNALSCSKAPLTHDHTSAAEG